MLLRDIVRRRLEALLLPWLREEPELELELGLINSRVTAKNLRFDVSSLNRLLGDSSGFSFGELGMDHFSLGFSSWSAPAFKIEVRGVNVTLLAGEVEEDGSLRRLRRPSKVVSDEKKKVLAEIDPEGSALHDVLERILVNSTSKNRFKTSLLNLVFKHCHMQIFDTIVQVRVPTSNDVLICLLQLEELNAESKYFEQGCLFRGLVGAAFKPLKESSIDLDFRGFEIGYGMNDHKNFIVSSTDLFTCVKLTDLQIAELIIRVPELSLSISPVEIPVLLVLSKLTSKESKHVRNGRQLWRLVANRLGYAISSPRLSLHNLVELVCVWLRYLNAYENLLSVLGHSADSLLEDSSIKISQDTMLLTSVKNNWEVICCTEKVLPAEAVAQARRIARYRAALDVQNGEDGYKHISVNCQFKVFSKMLSLVVIIWHVICRMFLSMMNFFFLIKFSFQGQKSYEYSGVHSPQYRFLLNFGRILIKLSPKYTVQNVSEDIVPPIGISYSNADSVSLSIDALLLVYGDKIFEQSLSVSCGVLKVKSSSVIGATTMQQGYKNRFRTMKGHQEGRIDNLETVLHSEPADMFLPSQTTKTRGADQAEHAHNPLLKKFLGETWLNWKEVLTKYDDGEYEISESPWVLIDIKSYLTYPGRKSLDSGLWKCCLSVGKLNLTLAHPSVLLTASLIGQIWQAMNWNEEHGTQSVLSNSPPWTEIQLESSWEGMYEFYVRKLKMAVIRRLPGKHIQLGVFITGPHIQLSLQKDGVNYGNDDMNKYVSHLGFNIHNIEVVIWSSANCNLALTECLGSEDAETECLLREPQMIEIPKSDNEKFASQECISFCSCLRINGLDIYMADWSEKQHNQIFVLKPIEVRSLLIRESVHSFSTTIIALSAALCGMAKGFTITLFMDELYVLFQVVADLFLALSHASGSFDAVGCVPGQDLMVFTEPENNESTTEGAPLIQNSTLISINGTFRFKSMDIILHKTRMNDKLESPIEIYGAFGCQKLAGNDLPDCGIWTSLHQACVEIYCEEEKLELLLNLSGIQSVLFHQDHIGKSFSHFVIEDLLQKFSNWLYEISLSSCTFNLWLRQPCQSSDKPSDNSTSSSCAAKNSHQITESQLSNAHSSTIFQNMELPAPLSHWILISAALSGFYAARCTRKNILVGAHQSNELTSFLSVEINLQKICWKMQGGLLLLETTASGMFARCFASYLDFIMDHLSNVRSLDKSVEIAEYEAQEIQHSKWRLPKAFSIDVSQFSFVLVVEDESGYFQELVLQVDVHMKLESAGMLKKFRIDLPNISIFIQVLKEYVESENQIPHFSSLVPPESSSHPFLENSDVEFQHTNGAYISHQNHIVKHLVASLSVEKPKHDPLPLNQVWVGNGSVLGFDMIISLSELKMISLIASSFSTVYTKEATIDPKQRHQSSDNVTERSFEDMVPDGAVVAVKDIHQHMYFGVKGLENEYDVVGTIHYSLLGEKALFRVKHHKQRIWKSSVLWFSLMSLHAKHQSGEPLRLNYRPGSAFVDISSDNDGERSLWTALSCETENYKGDIDWEPYNKLVKGTFYLFNKKNDSGVAFVDGIPEFVRKPGNPFKFKVFHDFPMARDVAILDGRASWENVGPNEKLDKDQTSKKSGLLPCIQIRIDNIALTVVHELPDTRDRFPLLHGCISNTQMDVQVLPHKARVMGTSTVLLNFFDAQRNLWRELVRPVDVCAFYHSSLQTKGSKTPQHMVPVHIYCRTKELDISLTELSLDILLFVIGKLNLAGPFSVRSPMIFSNCCQVENLSSLNIICDFFDKKGVTVAGKQSASVFLRHPVLANQQPEGASVVTIQLSDLGSLATSSLHLSLIKTQALAWRTRIMSPHDFRTYPGPFIVVDISRKTEDGLSLVISPLLRIHNETGFSMELRFWRPQQNEDAFASVLLKKGESVDDSMAAFDAINMSGGLKKALISLTVGNFYFSFRPEITDELLDSLSPFSVAWSDELKGGKAVRLSGIFDKLSYQVRRALSVESIKFSFDTACCTVKSEDQDVTDLHFLIQTISRNVTISEPDKSDNGSGNRNSAVALQEQKEIFLLPTVCVSNLLHSEINVLLTETDKCTTICSGIIGKQATIPCGSTVDFYANPALLYFTVTLNAWNSSCKTVNIGDWTKKLLKNKNNVKYLEIDLDFGGGKYFASLRLSRGLRGILEAAILTPYSLKNDTDFPLYFFSSNVKPLTRDEIEKFGSSIPPESGLFSPPSSVRSWFLKSHKLHLRLLKDHASEALLNLDALSGLTEVSLEIKEPESNYIMKFGVSMGPSAGKAESLSQTVTMAPRHVVFNVSGERILVRQCYLEDETAGIICVNSKQRTSLQLQNGIGRSRELSLFENIIRKHRNDMENSQIYIQFRPNDSELSWSGPVCITSLGHFFLKFRRQPSQVQEQDYNVIEFASVHMVEEGSTLCARFHKPSNINLPYRIENCLQDTSLTFYQKDSSEREVLSSGGSSHYVWDDLTLPHKLVVLISDMHLLREINLDKVRAWKPFLKPKHRRGLASHSLLDKKPGHQKTYIDQFNRIEIVNVGYEVYTEGLTRVLRICEPSDSHEEDSLSQTRAKIQLKVFHFAIRLLEYGKQDSDQNGESTYTPIIAVRFANISLDSAFSNQQKYSQLNVQALSIDEKWAGAPFAAMLRTHQLDLSESNASTIKIVFVLLATSSNVRQVKYSSIVLQPIDLYLDEETLMKVATFWRTSLSDSTTPSQQYYFDHFEVHPIKIVANFLPGDSYSSYNSAQETLRTLLHSVIKVPPIKNMVVELNGILVTHALITMRELFIRCTQHYSWYAMRAIYIAKGSPLLPPAFASIFDDLSSSSLDVFFDPSQGLVNLPGFTLGTLKFISKSINGKGFSGTKRYFGDLGKTLKVAGSNVLFAAVTEISDSVLKGAETSGFNGMVSGFHQGILKLAMEPSLLGTALMEGGPDRKVKLDRSPGVDELYIEGYLQAMLDTMYRQEYLRVRVIDDQVLLKNLPPNSALIDEIIDRVKGFLVSKGLLKADPSMSSRPLRHLKGQSDWKIGPTLMTLCEHLLVSYAIRMLRKHTSKLVGNINWRRESDGEEHKAMVPAEQTEQEQRVRFRWKWGISKFVLSGILAYVDGRLCRFIPNPVARRIVSGYLLSFLDKSDGE